MTGSTCGFIAQSSGRALECRHAGGPAAGRGRREHFDREHVPIARISEFPRQPAGIGVECLQFQRREQPPERVEDGTQPAQSNPHLVQVFRIVVFEHAAPVGNVMREA